MSSIAASLAHAITQAAAAEGATTPEVRGADWQPATVTAVRTDGTVDCGDIRARRLDTYISPRVGDLIIISRSGAGSWIAAGRLAASGTGGWTPLPLHADFAPATHGFPPAYRVDGRQVSLRGRIIRAAGGTFPANALLATLPAAIRPALEVAWAAPRAGAATATIKLEIQPAGTLTCVEASLMPSWVGLEGGIYWLD